MVGLTQFDPIVHQAGNAININHIFRALKITIGPKSSICCLNLHEMILKSGQL